MVRTLSPAPAGLMVFHLREAKRWRLRLGDESTNLDDQIESLRVSGATDAEVAADTHGRCHGPPDGGGLHAPCASHR